MEAGLTLVVEAECVVEAPAVLAAQLLDFHSTMFRAVLTISLYPVASLLLGRSQRILLGAS